MLFITPRSFVVLWSEHEDQTMTTHNPTRSKKGTKNILRRSLIYGLLGLSTLGAIPSVVASNADSQSTYSSRVFEVDPADLAIQQEDTPTRFDGRPTRFSEVQTAEMITSILDHFEGAHTRGTQMSTEMTTYSVDEGFLFWGPRVGSCAIVSDTEIDPDVITTIALSFIGDPSTHYERGELYQFTTTGAKQVGSKSWILKEITYGAPFTELNPLDSKFLHLWSTKNVLIGTFIASDQGEVQELQQHLDDLAGLQRSRLRRRA